jgi:hypothetical protein
MDKDLREKILDKEIDGFTDGMISRSNIYNAMDEYFKVRSMELLEWMGKNKVECDDQMLHGGGVMFFCDGDYLTKEELFKNFL